MVITGASANGLGAQTAIDLAKSQTPPERMVLLARSANKVQPVIDNITSTSPSIKTTFVSVSLDSLDSVRKAGAEIMSIIGQDGKIDLLINNAGIMAVPYSKSPDGIESQFAINHVGHFLLTKLLYPAVKAAGPEARIINLSSSGYLVGPFRPDDYNFGDGNNYDEWSGYGQSKTANILFTKGLAARGVTSFAVHPGAIFSTGLTTELDPAIFEKLDSVAKKNTGEGLAMDEPKSIEQGVSTTIIAALDPRIVPQSGAYMTDCHVQDVRDYAKDPELVQKLWDLSERLTGEKFEI